MSSLTIEVPLNKLVHSKANVRKTAPMLGVEELADNIAAHGARLIQSLAVRPIRTDQGEETGMYSVPAGGRRLAALKLLAKRKVIAKTAPIPCIVRDEDEREISLSENVMREPLHPSDQFDAFKALADRGRSAEEIGARFGVTAQVVRQRLRLAAVSPALIERYRQDELTLDQLIAFAVTEDHERQEQVYALLASNRQPYLIRRMLTETQVPARDRRAIFVGADAYVVAGGAVTRDLFAEDSGGWFSDPALLDRLVVTKLDSVAAELQGREGWKWVEVSIDYPHSNGMRRAYPKERELSGEERTELEALSTKHEAFAAECETTDEISEEASDQLDSLASDIEAITQRAYAFDPADIARAGAFVSLGHEGTARIERGFIRLEDIETPSPAEPKDSITSEEAPERQPIRSGDAHPQPTMSDALVRDLTAHRTMALRVVVGDNPEVALTAVVHALALRTFNRSGATCLELTTRSMALGPYAPEVEGGRAGSELSARHDAWARRLPEGGQELWTFVAELTPSERLALFAHCAAMSVFAVGQASPQSGGRFSPADTLSQATTLDMSTYWTPTAASYFGRITKAEIIRDVHEAVSDEAARKIAGLSKGAMAEAAETLFADRAWLPTCLRTPAG